MVTKAPAAPVVDERIPFTDKIFVDLAETYLNLVGQLREYNEALAAAEKQASENVWTANKLLSAVKDVARPEDKDATPDNDAEKLLSEYESALEAVSAAKLAAAKYMAGKLDVEMVAERTKPDAATVENLKENVRKPAVELQRNFAQVSKFSSDPDIKSKIEAFVEANPIPQVGRDGTLNVLSETSSTPKYRVDVSASRNGSVLFSGEDGRGFTKASLSAKKIHAKGKAPTRENFQTAWEAGDKKSTTFTHEGVEYTLTARK
jgi:hypothetical protein